LIQNLVDDLAVFFDVVDYQQSLVDAQVDVLDIAEIIEKLALLSGRQRVKYFVAGGVLVENLAKLIWHRQAVLAFVDREFDAHLVARDNAESVALLFVDDYEEISARRHQRTLERFTTVDRAHNALIDALKTELIDRLFLDHERVPARFVPPHQLGL